MIVYEVCLKKRFGAEEYEPESPERPAGNSIDDGYTIESYYDRAVEEGLIDSWGRVEAPVV